MCSLSSTMIKLKVNSFGCEVLPRHASWTWPLLKCSKLQGAFFKAHQSIIYADPDCDCFPEIGGLRAITTMANVWQTPSASEKRPTIYTYTTKVGGPSYRGVRILDLSSFGSFDRFKKTIHFIEETQEPPGPLGWRHLVKRLVIRQWIRERNIWRERAEREPSRFEVRSLDCSASIFLKQMFM